MEGGDQCAVGECAQNRLPGKPYCARHHKRYSAQTDEERALALEEARRSIRLKSEGNFNVVMDGASEGQQNSGFLGVFGPDSVGNGPNPLTKTGSAVSASPTGESAWSFTWKQLQQTADENDADDDDWLRREQEERAKLAEARKASIATTVLSKATTSQSSQQNSRTKRLRTMEGWITKQGHKRKNWKKRWFVLSAQRPQLVCYYKSKEDCLKNKCKGYFYLSDGTQIQEWNNPIRPNTLRVYLANQCTDKPEYLMQCPNTEEMQQWVEVMGQHSKWKKTPPKLLKY